MDVLHARTMFATLMCGAAFVGGCGTGGGDAGGGDGPAPPVSATDPSAVSAPGRGDSPVGTEAQKVDVLYGDCSSFRKYAVEFVPEMVEIAKTSAAKRHALWAACFDGAPLRTLKWEPKVDFADVPSEIESNDKLLEGWSAARAQGLKPKLLKMIRDTPNDEPRSCQLEALEVAAQTDGVERVVMFTDAAIRQIDGIDLHHATPADIERAIERWAGRTKGLRGVDLMIIGVGRGTSNSAAVRNAQALFSGLAKRVGVRSFAWQLELPAGFGGSGG